ncbi:MAG TPA: hypothetical protein VJR27_03870 [Candidatus Saccharimonadales bacterium]|nr:hypothetical protein [Candidatus Saccharimonadales bacterium]
MLNSQVLWAVPILSLIGSGRYILAVVRGQAKPNRVSWFLWALAPLIAFAAEIKQGVGLQSVVTFMAGFGPLLIVITSFLHKKSVWKVTRFDLWCGALSLVGLALWLITRHGNVAIAFSIFADGLAGVPTLIKAYKDPKSESALVFALCIVTSALTLLTIKQWTFANYGFPVYLLTICAVLVFFIDTRIGERRDIKKRGVPFGETEL